MNRAPLVISDRDFERLNELIRFAQPGPLERPYLQALERELNRCQIEPANRVPRDVVTMGSRVHIRDLATGETETYTLVYPGEANFEDGRLSVVAPLGSAILGMRAGDVVTVRTPVGNRKIQIKKVSRDSGRRRSSRPFSVEIQRAAQRPAAVRV